MSRRDIVACSHNLEEDATVVRLFDLIRPYCHGEPHEYCTIGWRESEKSLQKYNQGKEDYEYHEREVTKAVVP